MLPGALSVDSGSACRGAALRIRPWTEVGNASSASIPLAIHDAVRDGVITEPVRIFAPGFGAGAVAGYAVLRLDPAVVAVQAPTAPPAAAADGGVRPASRHGSASEEVREAFR